MAVMILIKNSRLRQLTLTVVALVAVLACNGQAQATTSPAPPPTAQPSDDLGPIKLGILVGSTEGAFELTMNPGDIQQVPVRLINNASRPLAVHTYVANSMTLVNGGFGIESFGSKKTGATNWMTYPDKETTLPRYATVSRSAVIRVPEDAEPGQHVMGVVVQNAVPTGGGGTLSLKQISRYAARVTINVPGDIAPAITFGDASYMNTGHGVAVALAAANPGNQILRPSFVLTLKDANKKTLHSFEHTMTGFYPGTDTKLRMMLEKPLASGQYFVDATMSDQMLGDPATVTDVPLTIGVDGDEQGSAIGSPRWVSLLIGVALLLLMAAFINWLIRRRKPLLATNLMPPRVAGAAEVMAFLGDRMKDFKGDPLGKISIAPPDIATAGLVLGEPQEPTAAGQAVTWLIAADPRVSLSALSAPAALVTVAQFAQAQTAGETYQGPATLIAVANPQSELNAIQSHFFS